MMLARENTPTKQMVDLRIRVPARDEDTFASLAVFIPEYRHPMSCILTVQTNYLRHGHRTHVFKTDETYARNRKTILEFRPEASRQLSLHYSRVNAKVGKDASTDNTLNDGKFHW